MKYWFVGVALVLVACFAFGAYMAASTPGFWISIAGAAVSAALPALPKIIPKIQNNKALEKLRRGKKWK